MNSTILQSNPRVIHIVFGILSARLGFFLQKNPLYKFTVNTQRAKHSGAVYCNRSCLRRTAGGRAVTVNTIEIACIDFHQIWSVCECGDRLQLIKFWPYCAPGKGVCGGAKIFGSALQQKREHCLRRLLAIFFSLLL